MFINPSSVALSKRKQKWISSDDKTHLWCGANWGSAVSLFRFHPAVTELVDMGDGKPSPLITRVIRDSCFNLGVVHFPMEKSERLNASTWVDKHSNMAEIWMGDFNTFPDDGGYDMIELIAKNNLVHHELHTPFTFKAFPHDLISKPHSFRDQLNEFSTVEGIDDKVVDSNGNPNILVRFASVLDHIFHGSHKVAVKGGALPITDASDHAPIIADIIFNFTK